jgi:adenylate kinase
LVSDALMTDLVRDRLTQPDTEPGFILDGFPRTTAQAHALDEMLMRTGAVAEAPIVVLVAVADDAIVQRLSRRRVCAACSITQSVSDDTDVDPDPCPYCGGSLVRREDDEPATIRRRLATYASFAGPITAFYRERPKFASVDGSRHPDEVTAALAAHIEHLALVE